MIDRRTPLAKADPTVFQLIRREVERQEHGLELIASENFVSVAKPGGTLLGLALPHGCHLTHGAPVNFSGTLFRATHYGVREDTGWIDYDQVREIARRDRPRILIGGSSAYARIIDFAMLKRIA